MMVVTVHPQMELFVESQKPTSSIMTRRRLLPPPLPPSSNNAVACAAPSAPSLSPPPQRVDVYALPLATPVPAAFPVQTPPFRAVRDQQISRDDNDVDRVNVHVEAEDGCCPSVWPTMWFTTRLLAYHAAYCTLSLLGGAVVFAGLALSLLLLPLCGFGVVVFQTLLQCTYYLGRVDAKLHNLIAEDTEDEIEFPDGAASRAERLPLLPIHHPRSLPPDDSGRPRFSEDALSMFTPRAMLLVVYFGCVRLLLTLWSVLSVMLLVVFVLVFIGDDVGSFKATVQVDNEPLFYGVSLVVIVLSSISLHVFGRVSQAATRFFCCE